MRTLVLSPILKRVTTPRLPQARLEEAVNLTQAIALEVVDAVLVTLATIRPASYLGQGKIDELAALIEEKEIGLAVLDCALSPVQQRNLEKAWKCKVIDRTALILEIFGARARTHEGKLQVELAALNYQKSRLVRSWTHLERQRGGFGFLGGPGESQIEIDRRLIRDRIARIKRELESVVRTRELHRKRRRDVPYPLVAIVGYTNAGKSTLFNRLTGADVMAMNKLFATLDPTLRKIKLPSGLEVMLSDTVGFVSDLPHELVAAFRATLEEVREADLLLHVRDISHPDSTEQKDDVMQVLGGLLDEETLASNMVEVWNKIDLLETPPEGAGIAVSALTGAGVDQLLERLDERLSALFMTVLTLDIPAAEGEKLAWLYRHATVLAHEEQDGIMHITARMTHENAARWQNLGS
ncbi:MAG TPA: GTPase HflX [Rickettsiales bacterium]|nr:GTPase HflX [Rickettsiales bacterium]